MSDVKLRAKYMLLLDWRAQAAVLGGNVTSLCMICVYLQTSKYSKSPGYCIGHYVSAQPLTSVRVAQNATVVCFTLLICSAQQHHFKRDCEDLAIMYVAAFTAAGLLTISSDVAATAVCCHNYHYSLGSSGQACCSQSLCHMCE
eukprot:12114-Heterococcus_DN1.PRE.1